MHVEQSCLWHAIPAGHHITLLLLLLLLLILVHYLRDILAVEEVRHCVESCSIIWKRLIIRIVTIISQLWPSFHLVGIILRFVVGQFINDSSSWRSSVASSWNWLGLLSKKVISHWLVHLLLLLLLKLQLMLLLLLFNCFGNDWIRHFRNRGLTSLLGIIENWEI